MERWMQQLKETYMRMLEGKAFQDPVTGKWKIGISTNQNFDGSLYDLQAIKKREHATFNDILTANKKKQTPKPTGDGGFGGGTPYEKTADYDADGNIIPGSGRNVKPGISPNIVPKPEPRPLPVPKPRPVPNPDMIWSKEKEDWRRY